MPAARAGLCQVTASNPVAWPPGDNAGMDSTPVAWSTDVHQADWIASRLAPWQGVYPITIVIPDGFEAYARVLHPVDVPDDGGSLVRWADVAAWSGLPLRADAQFHSIALPPFDPGRPYPFDGQSPRTGTLLTEDASALAAIARGWTSTPDDCWFCVGDGFGWDGDSVTAVFTADGEPPAEVVKEPRQDPVPAQIRAGPRVGLPNREYLLYRGPGEDVTATATLNHAWGQCASLWWPADHAWCVASDVDLPWTYVGGPRGLIDAILADDLIEALPASPDDPVSRVEGWATAWIDELADALLAGREASLTTCRGSIRARLRRPGRLRGGALYLEETSRDGHAGSTGETTISRDEDLPEAVALYLTLAVLGLAGI
jgi:hypothetical protein